MPIILTSWQGMVIAHLQSAAQIVAENVEDEMLQNEIAILKQLVLERHPEKEPYGL